MASDAQIVRTALGSRERQEGDGDRYLETADRDTMRHFRAFLKENGPHCMEEWKRAEENQKFAAGGMGQWESGKDYRLRVDSGRPAITINDTELAVRALSGREVTARYEPKVISQNNDDTPRTEVYNQVIKWLRDKARADFVESKAYRNLIIGNYAVVEYAQRFDTRAPHGRTVMEQNPLWQHVWDRHASEVCFLDRAADARGYFVSLDEFLMLFPEQRELIVERMRDKGSWVGAELAGWPSYMDSGRYLAGDRHQIFMVNYQWWEREPAWAATVPPGFAPHPVGEEAWAPVAQLLAQAQLPPVVGVLPGQAPWPQVQQALQQAAQMAGDQGMPPPFDPRVLELAEPRLIKMDEEQWGAFSEQYAAMTGAPPDAAGPDDGQYLKGLREAVIVGKEIVRERKLSFRHFPRIYMGSVPFEQMAKTVYNSTVESMKEPARFKNLVVSMTTTQLQTAQQRGVVLTENAWVDDPAVIETRMARPFWFLTKRLNVPMDEAIKIIEGGGFPQGMSEFLALADQAVWRGTGLNPNTLGQMEDPRRVTTGVFEGLRDAAAVVSAWETEALRHMKQVGAELLLDFLATYYDRRDVLDIVGQAKAAQVPAQEEWATSFQYDCSIQEVPVTASQRSQGWEYLSRQGSIDKWVAGGIMPPWIIPKMLPDGIISEEDRAAWLRFLDQRGMGPNSPPPAPPGAAPAEGQGGQPPPEEG